MVKILLIDDEAYSGWKEVCERVLFQGVPIDAVVTPEEADDLFLRNEYDLILLDMRFGERDHVSLQTEEFTGYKYLKDYLRKSFRSRTFPIPVLLFTASNKIWHINAMMDMGADDYYIKEHPSVAGDLEFSRQNYERLKRSIPELIDLGVHRRKIHGLSMEILRHCERGSLSGNIKARIEQKLKLGYANLFSSMRMYQREVLGSDPEVLAFIIYWSILEELSHWFYNRCKHGGNAWTLRNGTQLQYQAGAVWYTKFHTIKSDTPRDEEISVEKVKSVSLSEQICGVLRYCLSWDESRCRKEFLDPLNKYRNKCDYIHSNSTEICSGYLGKINTKNKGYDKCVEVLQFINVLLGT